MTAPRFVAITQNVVIAPGAYLRVVPESVAARKRPHEMPEDEPPLVPAFEPCLGPDLEAGSSLDLNGKPACVVWADQSRAIIEVAGRAWLMSHMNPWEMAHHEVPCDRGSYVQEWIIREKIKLPREGQHERPLVRRHASLNALAIRKFLRQKSSYRKSNFEGRLWNRS